MQRGPDSTQVVETWTSALARSRSPTWIGFSSSGPSRIATRSRVPGFFEIGTRESSSESLPVVAISAFGGSPPPMIPAPAAAGSASKASVAKVAALRRLWLGPPMS